MKKVTIALILLLVICQFVFIQAVSAKAEFSKELFENLAKNKNEVPHIEIPKYKRIELANGMIIYLVEDHKLPIIEFTGYIKGGRRQEPKELAGISNFMLEMMNTGTQNFSEQELSRYKEVNGIDFGFSVKRDYYKFFGNALSSDQEELISLVADIFKNPKFQAKYFGRIKKETIRSLLQAKTQQSSLLNMYFYKNIYSDHPYSFANDIDLRQNALKNINPKTLKQFYNDNIAPNNIVLGIVGDIDSEKMVQTLKKHFKGWPKKNINIRKPEINRIKDNGRKIILVNKPDATQAKIKIGYNFFDNNFKEEVAFKIANRIYGGGGFGSRLMKNLRVKKGYVYGVQSNVRHSELGGEFYVTTEVKPEKSYETIQSIKDEMIAIKHGKNKIKPDELFKIINRYNAFFPKMYKSKLNILSDVMYNSELRERRTDYMNEYIQRYNNLNAKQTQKVFTKYTYPQKFFTVIVGKKEDILPQFKDKGIKIDIININ